MDGEKTGNIKIRTEHKLKVLSIIRKDSSVSRTEIFERTNISKPTVTRIIQDLLDEGLVVELGRSDVLSGRKPVNIGLNPNAYYTIGINLTKGYIYASVMDFSMNLKYKSITGIQQVKNEKDFLKTIDQIVNKLLQNSGILKEQVLGIGVGVPGIVNFETGEILDFGFTHNFPNMKLKEHLEETFGLKVLVDNNANTRALGEYWYGYGVGYSNIVFVICNEGIGSGIICEGNILRGKNNITGEIGHMTINIDGRKCTCGRLGCIEAYCSTDSITAFAKRALRNGVASSLLYEKNGNLDEIDYKNICECYDSGDDLCNQLMEDAACILSAGLQNLIALIAPEMLILSGNLFDASKTFFNRVVELTRERIRNSALQEVLFLNRKIADNLYEAGAAALIYKSFFESGK